MTAERRYHGSRFHRSTRAKPPTPSASHNYIIGQKNRVYVERLRIRHILPRHSDFR